MAVELKSVKTNSLDLSKIDYEFKALSTDTKPAIATYADMSNKSTVFEIDTKVLYHYCPLNIDATDAPTGWWSV